jgi:hypothetical protein
MAKAGLAGLDLLEQKITKAAGLIERLKREKNEMAEANKELKEKIDSLYITNEKLAKELETLKTSKDSKKDFDKTREEIKNKIEEMLVKFDGLEV